MDNSDLPNCRWYSGSGIYRHVWLTRASRLARVAHWGTCLTIPRITRHAATVHVQTRVQSAEPYDVETIIHRARGRNTISVRNPRLWSIEDPFLYFARTVVRVDGKPVDDHITPFGIRTAKFDSRRGFVLNGQPLKLKGVCLHHDAGCVGAAVPDRVWERRLQLLKEIGCNAIRCAHNPPAPEFLDLCDRMGFLVIDEAFDKWAGEFSKPWEWWMRQRGFAENWQRDLRDVLRRDRNHPSVILWSVGNETGQPGTSQVNPTLKRLVDFVRSEEPTRPVTAAFVNSNAPTRDQRVRRILSSAKHVDVLCVNYQEPMYEDYRAADPNVVICGSETFKYWRGGAMNVHAFDQPNPWYDVVKHDYVVGQFLWPGIDYLGESNTWPVRGWPTGIIDTCGLLKPEGWFQRSVWRPDDPVVRIAVIGETTDRASSWSAPPMFEHWNWPQRAAQLIEVRTQTNCESVELRLNGKSFGRRPSRRFMNGAVIWQVPYEPGELSASARNGDRVAATHRLATAGAAARVALQLDRSKIVADGCDVAHVVARLVDRRGQLVCTDDHTIQFEITGAARLLGADNGDLCDRTPYRSSRRQTRQGRCLAIVGMARKPGRITVRAIAVGAYSASCHITAVSPQKFR